jgi:heme A synthase
VVSVKFFRRLALLTALFAYLQIALGGVVRVSGSGLGCPDWPLCHGRPYPPADVHAIIEYSHRAVGSVTGILIIATVVLAWTVFRTQRPLVAWLASASLIGIVGEGVLGGVVVARELSSWLVLFHLGLAMIILGFLVATAVMSLPTSVGVKDRSFRRLAAAGAAATYLLLLTGSTVVASGADESCHSWPLCGNGFALSFAGADAFTMLHRGSVLLIGILLVYVLINALRQPGLRTIAIATLVVFALQIAVGAGSALTDGALFNGLHVAIATLVWSGMLITALLTLPRTDRSPSLARLAVENRPA